MSRSRLGALTPEPDSERPRIAAANINGGYWGVPALKQRRHETDDAYMSERTAVRAYSVAQIAEALQLPDKQVYGLIHDGELAALRIGKHYRVTGEEFERYLQSGRRPD